MYLSGKTPGFSLKIFKNSWIRSPWHSWHFDYFTLSLINQTAWTGPCFRVRF